MTYARKYMEDGALDYPGLELSIKFHREKGQPYALVVILHCAQNHPDHKDLKLSFASVIEFHYEEECWGSIKSSIRGEDWLRTSNVGGIAGFPSHISPVLVVEDSPLVKEYQAVYSPDFGTTHYLLITGADILHIVSESVPTLKWIDSDYSQA